MKKILCIAAFAGMFTLGYCQDVKVNINNQEATTKEECPFKINGICSSEDIGGVDVTISLVDGYIWAIFTNYNSSPVTVLYRITCYGIQYGCNHGIPGYEYRDSFETPSGKTGSVVLGVEASKKIKLERQRNCHGDVIDNSGAYSIATISRKVSN